LNSFNQKLNLNIFSWEKAPNNVKPRELYFNSMRCLLDQCESQAQ